MTDLTMNFVMANFYQYKVPKFNLLFWVKTNNNFCTFTYPNLWNLPTSKLKFQFENKYDSLTDVIFFHILIYNNIIVFSILSMCK